MEDLDKIKMNFYIDTNIYLNFWQKEVDNRGNELWKIAFDFFNEIDKLNSPIYYSGFILKELQFIISKSEFELRKQIFNDMKRFHKVIALSSDYDKARKLEFLSKFQISFFDCMHIVLANKVNAILITRDKKLIDFARLYCRVNRPEEIINY